MTVTLCDTASLSDAGSPRAANRRRGVTTTRPQQQPSTPIWPPDGDPHGAYHAEYMHLPHTSGSTGVSVTGLRHVHIIQLQESSCVRCSDRLLPERLLGRLPGFLLFCAGRSDLG